MVCNTGNRLTELRKARGLKRHELAIQFEVDPSTIYRWETKVIPGGYIALLAEFFECSSDHLLGLDRVAAGTGEGRA